MSNEKEKQTVGPEDVGAMEDLFPGKLNDFKCLSCKWVGPWDKLKTAMVFKAQDTIPISALLCPNCDSVRLEEQKAQSQGEQSDVFCQYVTFSKVESSNIDSIGHDQKDLYIKFKGGAVYKYLDVPSRIYEEFLTSESKGKFLNSRVKTAYKFERLDDFKSICGTCRNMVDCMLKPVNGEVIECNKQKPITGEGSPAQEEIDGPSKEEVEKNIQEGQKAVGETEEAKEEAPESKEEPTE